MAAHFVGVNMNSTKVLELDKAVIYAEDDSWLCDIGGKSIKLGVVFEAVDLAARGGPRSEYPVIVEAQIFPQPDYLDENVVLEASEEESPSRENVIWDVYRYHGGVPVNIDAIQPARASCGVSSFVTDQEIQKEVTSSGQEIEVRHFKSAGDALQFAREFYVLAAPTIFEFLDWVLDQPLGEGTGWDKIRMLTTK